MLLILNCRIALERDGIKRKPRYTSKRGIPGKYNCLSLFDSFTQTTPAPHPQARIQESDALPCKVRPDPEIQPWQSRPEESPIHRCTSLRDRIKFQIGRSQGKLAGLENDPIFYETGKVVQVVRQFALFSH